MSTLERAIEIAQEAHRGQVDRAGEEYIGHPLRVMEAGRTLEEKIVGGAARCGGGLEGVVVRTFGTGGLCA